MYSVVCIALCIFMAENVQLIPESCTFMLKICLCLIKKSLATHRMCHIEYISNANICISFVLGTANALLVARVLSTSNEGCTALQPKLVNKFGVLR